LTVSAARPETRPVENPALDRFASAVVTLVPPLLLVAAIVFGWGGLLHWNDLLVFTVTYLLFGFGITVGFHRLLTHGSFKTHRWLRLTAAALGSAAVEGPVIEWVATHRKHHQYSDAEGDPHSPHVGHGSGFRGALNGLFYAHIGWVFRDAEVADEDRYAKDLRGDPLMSFVDATFFDVTFSVNSPATSSAASRTSPATIPATSPGWRCRRWGSPGTTTTTPSRPPPGTACAAGSWTAPAR
jgi:stearoyl-CoA desaturase (Delta-9 desaturase)